MRHTHRLARKASGGMSHVLLTPTSASVRSEYSAACLPPWPSSTEKKPQFGFPLNDGWLMCASCAVRAPKKQPMRNEHQTRRPVWRLCVRAAPRTSIVRRKRLLGSTVTPTSKRTDAMVTTTRSDVGAGVTRPGDGLDGTGREQLVAAVVVFCADFGPHLGPNMVITSRPYLTALPHGPTSRPYLGSGLCVCLRANAL